MKGNEKTRISDIIINHFKVDDNKKPIELRVFNQGWLNVYNITFAESYSDELMILYYKEGYILIDKNKSFLYKFFNGDISCDVLL